MNASHGTTSCYPTWGLCLYKYIYIYKERQRDRETERVNFVRMWCETQILPLQSQHATLSYHIFMNKHNHTYT